VQIKFALRFGRRVTGFLPGRASPRAELFENLHQNRFRGYLLKAEQAGLSCGRLPSPSVVILDSQSVKTTERGGTRGFDYHNLI
jgi:hypothetical protein